MLNEEFLYFLEKARIVIENWRRHDKEVHPHSSRGNRPPAPPVRLTGRPAVYPRPIAGSDLRHNNITAVLLHGGRPLSRLFSAHSNIINAKFVLFY